MLRFLAFSTVPARSLEEVDRAFSFVIKIARGLRAIFLKTKYLLQSSFDGGPLGIRVVGRHDYRDLVANSDPKVSYAG